MKKLSLYTFLFERDSKYYVYSTESNYFCEISKELYILLKEREWSKIPGEILDSLTKQKIIIDDSEIYNYFYSELLRYNIKNYNPTILNLIIAPTTGCNLDCFYCFEPKSDPKTINDETIAKLVQFIKNHEMAKKINITWYGGEPLLAFAQIKQIYSTINELKTPQIESQTIITNGVLFNNEVINFFKETGLKRIQITLDGERNQHDKIRCLKASKHPTFDTIMFNIDNIVKNLPGTTIDIRVNIDKNNYNDYINLNKSLSSKYGNSSKVCVYPGLLRKETYDRKSLCQSCFQQSELISLRKIFRSKGIKTDVFPRKCAKGCMMQSANSYIIGPIGEIYKCWNDVSDKNKVVGNISNDYISQNTLFINYMTGTPAFDDKCKNCKVFPICDGGCGLYRYRNSYEGGEFDICSPYKDKNTLIDSLFQ